MRHVDGTHEKPKKKRDSIATFEVKKIPRGFQIRHVDSKHKKEKKYARKFENRGIFLVRK